MAIPKYTVLSIVFVFQVLMPGLYTPFVTAETNIISAIDADKSSRKGDLLLIDIRSAGEWLETGVAHQAVLISMHQTGGLEKFSSDLLTMVKGNKQRKIALICAGGIRSALLQYHLRKQGYSEVLDVSEGMQGSIFKKGWIDQSLPTVAYTLNQ
ncbi:MAG: rhodanese-related sulfurtransferase [Candidatus Endobugula sp.]|jgi:rhodanese-related sulfurtransferase